MRTRSALALSVAGILVTGSAALAVNTQTLNNSPAGTTGNANQFLLPQDSAISPATSPAPEATASSPSPTSTASATPDDNRTASPLPTSAATPPSDDAEDDKGGLRETPEPGDDSGGQGTPEPGDDKGGQRTPEPGDDSGGHGSDD